MNSEKIIKNNEESTMPLISGTHQCSNCNKDLEWECFIRKQHVEAFTYTGKLRASLLNNPLSKELQFRLRCDKCDGINFFVCHNNIHYKNNE